MVLTWFVPFITGLIIFLIIGWFPGTDEYGGLKPKVDERVQMIKQKAIVSSWLLLLVFFVIHSVFKFFELQDKRLALIPNKYPELLYLLIAIVSYCIYYWIYRRRMSSHEK